MAILFIWSFVAILSIEPLTPVLIVGILQNTVKGNIPKALIDKYQL